MIPAEEVEREHTRWLRLIAEARPVSRLDETESINRGRAAPTLPEAAE